mmetsp:Transcript_30274/g.89826  ORF Transcript_30274/g.89826 Transcript_30274/m.89826 type:complete len:115 (+) Transcript_30274:1624-1968(+)
MHVCVCGRVTTVCVFAGMIMTPHAIPERNAFHGHMRSVARTHRHICFVARTHSHVCSVACTHRHMSSLARTRGFQHVHGAACMPAIHSTCPGLPMWMLYEMEARTSKPAGQPPP